MLYRSTRVSSEPVTGSIRYQHLLYTLTPIHILFFAFCILFLNNHLSSQLSPLAPPSYLVVFIRRATVCFVPATDEDNHTVVKMFGIIIQILVSRAH